MDNFITEKINSRKEKKLRILNKNISNLNNSKFNTNSYNSKINDTNSMTLSNSQYLNSLGNSINNTVNNTVSNTVTNSSTPYIPCAMSAALIHGKNQKLTMKIKTKHPIKFQNYKYIQEIISTNLSINCNNSNKIPFKQLKNIAERSIKIPNNNFYINNSSIITKSSKNKNSKSPKKDANLKKQISNKIKLKKSINISLTTYRSMKNIKKNCNKNKKFNAVGRNYSNNYNQAFFTNNNIIDNKCKNNIKIEKPQRINLKNNNSTSKKKIIFKTYSSSLTNIIPKTSRNTLRDSSINFRKNISVINNNCNSYSKNKTKKFTKLKNNNYNSYSKNKTKRFVQLKNNNINISNLFGQLFNEFNKVFKNNLKNYNSTNSSRININSNDIQIKKPKLSSRFIKMKYYTLRNGSKDGLKKNGLTNGKNKNSIPKNFKTTTRKLQLNNKFWINQKDYRFKLEEVKERIRRLFYNYMAIIDLINNTNKNN